MIEDLEAKNRKYRKNLVITGYGFIVIEFWALIKFVIRIGEDGGFKVISGDQSADYFTLIRFFVILFAFFIFITLFHFYIGLSSAGYGAGKSKHWGFIPAAIVYIGFTVYEFPDLIRDVIDAYLKSEEMTTADNTVASILLEATILFILCDMIVSAILLMINSKKLELKNVEN